MQSSEPSVNPGPPSGDGVVEHPHRPHPHPHPRFAWAWALAAALIAGSAAWAIGERTFEYYQPSEAAAKNIRDPGPLRRELAVTVPRNVAIAYGTMGALFGMVMGLAGGLSRRSIAGGIGAAIAGTILGIVAASLLAFALVPVFQSSFDPAKPNLMLLMLVRGGIWSAVGASAGVAFGLGLGRHASTGRAVFGGLMAGLFGAVVFEVANAIVNPLDRNEDPIPTTQLARLLAYTSIALLVAFAVALAARAPNPPTKPAPGRLD